MRELTVREFKNIMRENGFKYSRDARGSHEIWENTNGEMFTIPTAKKMVKAGLVWQFMRLYVK
jgi:predicted RNA binding protein YcfA (HicA-like mRNA interferase family)